MSDHEGSSNWGNPGGPTRVTYVLIEGQGEPNVVGSPIWPSYPVRMLALFGSWWAVLFGEVMSGYRVRMRNPVLSGALAGAAGTTVLNAVTYLDMTITGRAGSDLPNRSMAAVGDRLGVRAAGDAPARQNRQNRLSGLGGLIGIAIGVGVGVGFGLLRACGFRPPAALGPVPAGAAAMATADLPMARLGVTNLRTWSVRDWLTGVLPHLAYGATTCAMLAALDRKRRLA